VVFVRRKDLYFFSSPQCLENQELDRAYVHKLVASYESDPELVQLPPVDSFS
jgi:hypothetical protein